MMHPNDFFSVIEGMRTKYLKSLPWLKARFLREPEDTCKGVSSFARLSRRNSWRT